MIWAFQRASQPTHRCWLGHTWRNRTTSNHWKILRAYYHGRGEDSCQDTILRKSPEPDGILPEVLVYGGSTLVSVLFTIFNLFWITENLPSDLIDAIICILYKKSDRSHCGNYCGISLLSVVGKIFADIILRRLQGLVELVCPESQSGYSFIIYLGSYCMLPKTAS